MRLPELLSSHYGGFAASVLDLGDIGPGGSFSAEAENEKGYSAGSKRGK